MRELGVKCPTCKQLLSWEDSDYDMEKMELYFYFKCTKCGFFYDATWDLTKPHKLEKI